MKTKHKVTATLTACFGLVLFLCFNMLNTKEEVLKVTVDVTSAQSAKLSDLSDQVYKSALADFMAFSQAAEAGRQLAVLNNTQVISSFAMDPIEVIDAAVNEHIEDAIVTTLSLSEPEFNFDKVLPKVSEYLNVRSEPNQEAKSVGKLYKNSYATILERGEEWTKIRSGKVTGYVNNEYLYFDKNAITKAKSLEAFQAKITAGIVNVRSKPTTDSEIIVEAKKDDTFIHIPEMDSKDWVAILYDEGTIAYVSKDYIETTFELKTAVSAEEEEEARKAAELAKALQEAKKHKPQKTNRAAITVSDEDLYLLATVVAMEAIGESYEGQLAVANVVINRMLDGYWGDTIPEVVYAKGQFSGANSGRVEKFAPKVTESCKRAAVEALAGNNNIGNYMYFIMKGKANYSSYTKYYILGCHVFYSRS